MATCSLCVLELRVLSLCVLVAKYEEGGGLNSWMAMVVGIRVRSALDIPVHMKPLRRSEAPPDALGVAKKLLRTDYKQHRSPTTGGTRC